MKTFSNIRDVLKNIKHKKSTHIYCPKCSSPKLTLSSSLDYWLTPQRYLCKECGYVGVVFMELEKEEEKDGA
jgi:transposase-like protein